MIHLVNNGDGQRKLEHGDKLSMRSTTTPANTVTKPIVGFTLIISNPLRIIQTCDMI